jgi:hypothetical protein
MMFKGTPIAGAPEQLWKSRPPWIHAEQADGVADESKARKRKKRARPKRIRRRQNGL